MEITRAYAIAFGSITLLRQRLAFIEAQAALKFDYDRDHDNQIREKIG
jgi:hypothetical protein